VLQLLLHHGKNPPDSGKTFVPLQAGKGSFAQTSAYGKNIFYKNDISAYF
jgi:hypothetical protein